MAVAIAFFWAFEMVKVSAAFGRTRLIPGLMTVCLASLGAISSRFLPKLLFFFDADDTLMTEIRSVSTSLSDACFYLLFAAIGASANLRQAVENGGWHFASGALFASAALLVHTVTLFAGSLAVQRLFRVKWFGLEDLLVASNAAIGGPLTAAELASRSTRRHNCRGLIVAAVFWGAVGYVVATEAGISLTRLLLPLLSKQ